MSSTPAAPATPTPSMGDLIATAEKTVEAVDKMIPELTFAAGIIPGAAPLALVAQAAHAAAPLVEGVLKFMMAETGKSFMEVFADFVNHVTPGLPNAPILGPTQ